MTLGNDINQSGQDLNLFGDEINSELVNLKVNQFIIVIGQPQTMHVRSKSNSNFPKKLIQLQRSNTQPQNLTSPSSIKKKSTKMNSLIHLPKLQQKYSAKLAQQQKTISVMISPSQQQLINNIRQKATFLGMLRKKIIQCSDNIFVKRVLNQIRFTSIGKIAIQMWNQVQKYSECNYQFLTNLQKRFNILITEDFTRTMDFINNACRFLLADYKKKRWNNKEKQINNHLYKIDQNINVIRKGIKNIEKKQTKMEIIASIAGLKTECFARKQCYIDWKQRAIQKLKEKQVRDLILRAEIFTQQFS